MQPYQQSIEPPGTEQLFMNVGSVKEGCVNDFFFFFLNLTFSDEDDRGTRAWGTTAPDVKDDSEGTKRGMSTLNSGKKEQFKK